MSKGLRHKASDLDAPLMGAQQRAPSKRSWYRQTQTWVGFGIVAVVATGISLLFLEHGGDKEARGTKHYVPWGRQSPERIRNDYGGRGELARARARLERAVDKPVSNPTGLKDAAKGKLAAKKVSGTKSFNKWLDHNHKPDHTLKSALREYEKKHGYKRGHHTLHGGEHKAPDETWNQEYGKFLAKTHPVGHTLHDAGVHPDTYHAATTAPSKVCLCNWHTQMHIIEGVVV